VVWHHGTSNPAITFGAGRRRIVRQGKILGEEERLMAEVTIEARPNGPYVVTGTIELRDTNGNVLPTQTRVVLCRCGASTKKPFCDGTHSKIGFQAAAQAVPGSAESATGSDSGR
jgi:3-phenylpropionate/trans-cinnamate dioxygenase ferredoxin subunit